MFWPAPGVTSKLTWTDNVDQDDVPSCGVLVASLRPILRALFLQGYQTHSICFFFDSGSIDRSLWEVVQLDPVAVTDEPRSFKALATGVDIVFEVSSISDMGGLAPAGYAVPDATTRLSYHGTWNADGELPPAFTSVIDDLASEAIDRLALTVSNRIVPRGDNGGLLWIFNPAWFGEASSDNRHAVDEIFNLLLDFPRDFIQAQVFDDQRRYGSIARIDASDAPPSYRWLAKVANVHLLDFWQGIRLSLESQGYSERLTSTSEARLEGPNSPSWLDVILELLRLGVLSMDGLIEAEQPVEPLSALRIDGDPDIGLPEAIDLQIWGETIIRLLRSTPTANPAQEGGYATGIDGSVAWEYVRNRGGRPKVVVVASRGIQVVTPRMMDHLPWDLDLYRVQDDALVPTIGASINTKTLLGAATLPPHPGQLQSMFHGSHAQVVVRGKKDGMSLEFPAGIDGPQRLILELTLETPESGLDGYTIGLYYYDYRPAEGMPLATGVHICVWATSGVKIESNGTGFENDQGLGISIFNTAWTASAEFWELDDILGIEHIVFPFAGELNFTRRLALNDELIESAFPPFSDDLSTKTILVNGATGARLTPKTFTPKEYDDSYAYLAFDLLIGLIPGVGDLADLSELTLAYATGMDRWGRPVTNFDLALMTIGTAIPFASNSFVRGIKKVADGEQGDVFHGEDLINLYRQSIGFWNIAPESELAEAAAAVSTSWSWNRPWQHRAQDDAVLDLLGFFSRNTDGFEDFGRRFCEETGESWLVLDDIYDAQADGFQLNAIQAAYRRWQSDNGNSQNPELFLRSLDDDDLLDTTAKIVADALLGPHMVGARRRTPQMTSWPSDVRPAIDTTNRHLLSDLSFINTPADDADFLTALDDIGDNLFREGATFQIVESGMLRPLTEVIQAQDRNFIDEASDRLLRDSLADGSVEALATTIGNNVVGQVNLSARERATRFSIGLCIAVAELRRNLLDVRQLLSDELLPELREFVRTVINRGSQEIGARFELSRVTEFVTRLRAHQNVEAIRTQLRMPLIDTVPGWYHYQPGPDIVLYLTTAQGVRRAVFVQLKAYRNLLDLASTRATPYIDSLQIGHGPEFFRQAVSDALRVKHDHWEGAVPGPAFGGMVGALPPAEVDDWVETANVHVFMFDEDLLRDTLSQALLEARRRTQDTTILTHHFDNDPRFRTMFSELFPQGVPANSDEEVRDLIFNDNTWIDQWITAAEEWLNRELKTHLEPINKEPIEILIRRSTTDPNEIVGDLLDRIEEL